MKEFTYDSPRMEFLSLLHGDIITQSWELPLSPADPGEEDWELPLVPAN